MKVGTKGLLIRIIPKWIRKKKSNKDNMDCDIITRNQSIIQRHSKVSHESIHHLFKVQLRKQKNTWRTITIYPKVNYCNICSYKSVHKPNQTTWGLHSNIVHGALVYASRLYHPSPLPIYRHPWQALKTIII